MQTFCCAVIVTIISFFSLTTITNANNEGHRQQYTSYQYDNNKPGLHRTLRRLTRQNRRLKSTVKQKNRQIKQLRQYKDQSVQLGPRPFFLVDDMDEGPLKTTLQQCSSGPFYKTDFSIGHRGAALQFPEHTRESFMAAAKMGAGVLECDVTFTKDRELVCRHSQCDLHTTTDILATPLAAKCSQPFTPADSSNGQMATANCCTSDITLAEYKTLQGKMDGANPLATTVDEYLQGTPSWRTDLYSSRGTLLTHAESIQLFKELGSKFTPELKEASVSMPFQGDYTQADYAQQMIDEYITAGINPDDVWPQSFNIEDVNLWVNNNPAFGQQATLLDDRPYTEAAFVPSLTDFEAKRASGIRIIAPPTFALVSTDSLGNIIPSDYAKLAKQAGLDIISWTIERSGLLANGGGFYYQSIADITNNDGDVFNLIDVLAKDVGVIGLFTDWPATTTYYANCMNL